MFSCRPLDPEVDCPTCPSCDCITDDDCPDCHQCIAQNCNYFCADDEICCSNACVFGDCCNSADCSIEGTYCINNVCQVPSVGVVCGIITQSVIDTYIFNCLNTINCNFVYHFAFDVIDLTGYGSDNILAFLSDNANTGNDSVQCCQSGSNCEDGVIGCLPNCTQCCDVFDCENLSFFTNWQQHVICSNGQCVDTYIYVPSLPATDPDTYYRVDYSGFDFINNSYSCSDLKAARTDLYTRSGGSCSDEDGKVDSDFPCMFRIATLEYAGICPTNCSE